ncbi:hypothetical protein ACFLU5_17820 [Bacteroidota bacterium]
MVIYQIQKREHAISYVTACLLTRTRHAISFCDYACQRWYALTSKIAMAKANCDNYREGM